MDLKTNANQQNFRVRDKVTVNITDCSESY